MIASQKPNFEADFNALERRAQQAYGKVSLQQKVSPIALVQPVDAQRRIQTSKLILPTLSNTPIPH